jgi:N-acetylglutamate synthase
MVQGEAEMLHEGLRRSFAVLFDHIEGARLEGRSGYRLAVCPSMPFPGLNGVWVDGPDESMSAAEIEAAIIEVESEAMPCWIELRNGHTPTFERIARSLGFTNEQPIPGMVARRDELVVVVGPKVAIERVADREGLGAAAAVAAAGFEAPPGSLDPLYTTDIAAIPGLSTYVATVDGRPVSTAISWTGDGGVGIFNVATPPEYRGRGYGRAVTQMAVTDGFAAGAALAWLQASEMGDPVYRAMGFRQVEKYLILGRPATA